MANHLADLLLSLASGVPVGQSSICQIPLEVSARMSEAQLLALTNKLNGKNAAEEDLGEPEPREYHREWAKQNKMPGWMEAELWERKRGSLG